MTSNTNCTTVTTGVNNNSTHDNNEHNVNNNNLIITTTSTTAAATNNDINDDGNATTSTAMIPANNVSAPIDCNNDVHAIANNDGDSDVAAGIATGSIRAEYNKINERTGWHRLYQEIREKSEREAAVKNYSTKESEKPKNRCLNRYRDVNPYDHSRIILHRGSVDYINANLVKVKRAGRQYILTQGPLADTVAHFWLMVWEQNSRAILMLNKIIEKKQIKCHKYWPDHVDHPLTFAELKLTVEFVRSENYKNFLCRWFKLTDQETKESRNIIQFHYTTWPDFGIPTSPVTFLQFLKQVRKSGTLDSNVGPAVVHCSAGIGRSGTFCLVDCCLVLFEKEGEDKVSVQDVLFEMRRYRMGLIQTADQLYFSYQAIIEGIKLLKNPEFLNYEETPTAINSTEDKTTINMIEHLLDNNEQGLQTGNSEIDELPPPLPPRSLSLLTQQTVTVTSGGSSYHNHQTDELNNMIVNGLLAQRPLPPLPPLPPAAGANHNQQRREQHSDSEENDYLNDDYDSEDSMSDDDNADIAMNDNHENIMDDDDGEDDNHNYDVENNFKFSKKNINVLSAQDEKQNEEGNHMNASTTTTVTATNSIDNDIYTPQSAQSDLMNNTTATNQTSTTTAGDSSLDNMQREIRRRNREERRNNLEDKIKEIKRMQREADVEAEKKGKRFAFLKRPFVAYLSAGVLVGALCVYAYTKMD